MPYIEVGGAVSTRTVLAGVYNLLLIIQLVRTYCSFDAMLLIVLGFLLEPDKRLSDRSSAPWRWLWRPCRQPSSDAPGWRQSSVDGPYRHLALSLRRCLQADARDGCWFRIPQTRPAGS